MKNKAIWAEKALLVLIVDGIDIKQEEKAIKSLSYCVASRRLIKAYKDIIK